MYPSPYMPELVASKLDHSVLVDEPAVLNFLTHQKIWSSPQVILGC